MLINAIGPGLVRLRRLRRLAWSRRIVGGILQSVVCVHSIGLVDGQMVEVEHRLIDKVGRIRLAGGHWTRSRPLIAGSLRLIAGCLRLTTGCHWARCGRPLIVGCLRLVGGCGIAGTGSHGARRRPLEVGCL